MKKILSIAVLSLAFSINASAQFFNTIKVEFEKVVYVRQQYKELEPEWYEQIKDRLPQTSVSYFSFVGNNEKSLYKLSKEAVTDGRSWYQPIADKNVVYNDYKTAKTIAQKGVFEETFLVEDSLANIKWKLTNDTRVIAGFECRKAFGLLNDSIGVFAFYTDELMVNGGPESFHGLPGMILGLSVPRLHTTWFASKVEVAGVNMDAVLPATKGKKMSRETMTQSIQKALKAWGDYGSKMIINFLI